MQKSKKKNLLVIPLTNGINPSIQGLSKESDIGSITEDLIGA